MLKTIDRSEISRLLKEKAAVTLVEALPEKYYAEAHLPGAVNINHDQVASLAPGLLQDKNAMIVVYCSNASCQNSAMAAQKLLGMGYSKVYKYAEGKQDWMEAGLPLENGLAAAL